MKTTPIQWCHSTINPVMGCQGCELWPKPTKFINEITKLLANKLSKEYSDVHPLIKNAIDHRETGQIYRDRILIADALKKTFNLTELQCGGLIDVIRSGCKCYAGLLGTNRAGHKGYADFFEEPKLFPGRMADAANWPIPSLKELDTKPWLFGAPRMIFISDMGDALSTTISFEYLRAEIIENVNSKNGCRHLWLWLTKRPERMAEFGQWLTNQGISWPDNLVAMTTVTSQSTSGRIDALRKVPSMFKGLSIEPLYGPVNLDLSDIDWAIVGGGSDALAEEFHVEWATDLHRQCEATGTAFFLKQLGKHPVMNGVPLKLRDKHGGDWYEWAAPLGVREIPAGFHQVGLTY